MIISLLPRCLLTLLLGCLAAGGACAEAGTPGGWERPVTADPNAVEMGGAWGTALARGLARIGQSPYSENYLLADLDFNMRRSFTNFSGDISGRFLELASVTTPPAQPPSPTLEAVMHRVALLQKPDGHFGAPIDWGAPIDFELPFNQAKMMPALWGNGRILLGLTAAFRRFGDPGTLEAARKLGDFYVRVAADRFCDPQRAAEYRKSPGYAAAYVTCVYQGVAGLVELSRVTHEAAYLQTARQMADFHETYDTLPVEHSHGSISVHEALLMLYEDTGDAKYLRRVTDRWEKEVTGGYVNPAGGVLEKLSVAACNRDEGCAEADWLRLNLMLWRVTGGVRYLDMAERLLWNEYLANQWPDGGFGHRFIQTDARGAYAFGRRNEEAVWCCCFHGPLGLHELKGYLAAGGSGEIFYNFPVDFTAPVMVGPDRWTVRSASLAATVGAPVRCEVEVTGSRKDAAVRLRVRVPGWADGVDIASDRRSVATAAEDGYVRTVPVVSGSKLLITYRARPRLETRLGERVPMPVTLPASLGQVVVREGPKILLNTTSGDIQHVELRVRPDGTLVFPVEMSEKMAPWTQVATAPDAPRAFVFDVSLEAAAK